MAETRPKNYPKLKNYTPTKFMLPTSHYDEEKADRAVRFIENLRHTKGKWAGKRFWLLPWQEQIVRDVFGIVDENGNRQFRTAFVEIGKKNGKSELAAAIALYLLFADNEPSAEVYGAAADRQQASIVFDVANQMVQMTPALMKRCKIMAATKRIVNYSNAGFYQVLSAEVGTKHGLNVSGLVLDEVHAQPNRKLYDVLTKGSGDAREQPLFFLITTAGTEVLIMAKNKINELRAQRAKTWDSAKAFLDSHRNEKGILSAADTATYEQMEQEIVDLGHEIERQERLDAMEREMALPVNTPITGKPQNPHAEEKTGRASDEYKKNFWNAMRSKSPDRAIVNALQIGTDSEGGYLVPDEFERTLVDGLSENNIFRTLAHVIQTTSGDRKIPVVASHGSASWVDEEGAYKESDEAFSQITIGAYKLGTMIKVSEELLNDSIFDIQSYLATEFARRIGNAEEEAFITGNGTGKPTGFLNSAELGVTAASATAITADDLINLYHSLSVPYRGKAVWLLNDSTVQFIRKLKDGNGQYLWQPGLVAGAPDTILGRPVKVSRYMPSLEAGQKAVAFGDFSYYWIADRQGRSFRRLDELFAATGQVGFRGSQRVDGKLILPEAIKVLQMK